MITYSMITRLSAELLAERFAAESGLPCEPLWMESAKDGRFGLGIMVQGKRLAVLLSFAALDLACSMEEDNYLFNLWKERLWTP